MAAGLAECVLVPGTLGGAAFEKVFFCASTKLGQRSGLLGANGSGMRRGPLGGTLSLRNDKFPLTGFWFCGLVGDDERRTLSFRNDKVTLLGHVFAEYGLRVIYLCAMTNSPSTPWVLRVELRPRGLKPALQDEFVVT